MIELHPGPKFLIWVTSGHFEERILTLLRQTGLRWSTFIDLSELENKSHTDWLAIVMNGNCRDLAQHLVSTRSKHLWRNCPLIFLGGPDPHSFKELKHWSHHAMPEAANELEWILRKACPPFGQEIDKKEQRGSYRHVCYSKSVVEIEMVVVDFGEGGVQIESLVPLPVGMELLLNMKKINPRLPADMPLQIIQVRPGQTGEAYRIHAKFLQLTVDQTRSIRRALVHAQSSSHKLQAIRK